MAYDIGPRIGIEGEAEFRKQIQNLISQQKTLASEMQAVTSAFDKNDTSEEKAAAQAKVLTQQIEVQKQKLDALNQGLAAATEKYGENDKVTLGWQQAVNKATAELNNMQRELSESTSESAKLKAEQEKLAKQVSDTSDKLQRSSEAIKSVNKVAAAGVAAIGGIAVAAGKTGADFEAQMSRVKAISGATGQEFEALSKQAVQLGADTAYSATEAAQGMENLASAGFSTKEIMAAMPGMLDLAASSGEDLANSADIAASTLRGFGLAADQAGHVADVLAKNAADTNAAVADTGAAMKYIAPVAKNVGWSLEEVTAAIGEMADAGIKGEQAGTTLRGALTNLMNPSKQQAEAMKAIGFSAYDANGKMKSLSEIIKELGEKTAGLTNEQRDNVVATIMGTNSLSGMQVLLKDGSANLDKLTASLKNSDGSAKEMAKTMQDNLKGAVEQLGGAAESAGIALYEKFAGSATDAVSGLADKVAELAKNLASGALDQKLNAIAAAAAGMATAIVGMNIALAVKDVKNFVKAVKAGEDGLKAYTAVTKAGTIAQTAYNLATSASPLGWFVIALAAVTTAIITLWNTNEGFRNAVIGAWKAIQQTAETVWNAVIGFFTKTIPQAWNNFVAFMKQWGPTILAVTAPALGIPLLIIQNWSQIKVFFENLWASIQATATAAWTAISTFFSGIWTAIQTAATNAWNSFTSFFTETIPAFIAAVGEWFQQLPYNLGYALGAAAAFVVNFGVDVWDWVTKELPKIIQGIVKWFSELPGNIWNFLVQVVTNIGTWGANMLQMATTWTVNTINAIGTWFSQLPGRIWAWLTMIITNIGTWGTNIYNSAVTATTNTINAITNWFSQLPGRIWTFFTNIVASVVTWGTNMFNTAQAAVTNVVNGIIQWFSDLPNQMLKIGENIVKGIWDGINGAISWLHDRITSFCDGIVDGFKKNLKIHSPSVLFADVIGKNIALGIGEGFTSHMASVASSMSEQVQRVAGNMAGIIGQMPSNMGVVSQFSGLQPAVAAAGNYGTTTNLNYTAVYNSPVAPTPADVNRINRQNAQRIALIMRRSK